MLVYFINLTAVDIKIEVLTAYYDSLCLLNFETLYPTLISAEVINTQECQVIKKEAYPIRTVLDKISASLHMHHVDKFDRFLSVLKNHDDIDCTQLAEDMTSDLLKSTTGIAYNNANLSLTIV